MKKYFFTMMTTAMLFASCSSDDTVAPDNGTENQEDLVEIKLGAGSRIGTSVTESRAGGSVDAWNNHEIGIYALNEDKDWTENTPGDIRIIEGMKNVKGTVAADEAGKDEANKNKKNTVTIDGSPKYYPRSGNDTYIFYGYYPYSVDEPTINDAGTEIKLEDVTFDAQTDIMRGQSSTPNPKNTIEGNDKNGYNAKYFRAHPDDAAIPDIVFNHLTTKLTFAVKKGDKYDDTVDKCKIQGMAIYGPEKYSLIIADASTIDENAIIWPEEDAETPFELTPLTDISFDNDNGYTIPDDESHNVAEAMVQPGLGTDQKPYRLQLTLSNGNEDPFVQTVAIKNQNITFEMGKAYTITLTIHGPQEITVTASLTPWEPVDADLNFDI